MITETHAMFAAIRVFCLGLPEAHEVEAWERPTFRVRNKIFAMPRERDGARPSIWCKAAPGVQMLLVSGDPETFCLRRHMSARRDGSASCSMPTPIWTT